MNEYIVDINEQDMRIDAYLALKLDISRAKVQEMIELGLITVNDKVAKSSYRPKVDDVICVTDSEVKKTDILPQDLNLDIVYEDDELIVVNKANGMVVHPAVGNPDGTLVNGLMFHSKNLSSINGSFRPGIVHRIDADTTGLLVVAKNDKAHEFLAKQLEEKTVNRKYIALVWGVIHNDTGTIDAPIGRDVKERKKMSVIATGKHAITHFRVLKRYSDVTLIELKLETGRTHQIRVHMNYIGFPIVNDSVYGTIKNVIDQTGQCLHAQTLGFIHPKTKEYVEFTSELPESFTNILSQFTKEV